MVQSQRIVEGQRYDINGATYVGRNGRLELEAAPGQSPIVTRRPDPRLPYQTQQERNAAAASQTAPAKSAEELEAIRLQNEERRRSLAAGGLTAEQRNALVERQRLLPGFERSIDEIERLYQQNYQGSRGGILGMGGDRNVADRWLPELVRPHNERFRSAADSLIGAIASIQGLTGGEMNSLAELRARFGPMLPAPGDADATIEDKIARLRAMLADQQGVIAAQLPAQPGQTPGTAPPPGAPTDEQITASAPPPMVQGPDQQVALSGGDEEIDPAQLAISNQIQQRVSNMLFNGTPDREIREYGRSVGITGESLDGVLSFRRSPNWQAWRRQNPNRAYPLDTTANRPMGPVAGAVAGAASSGPGTAFINSGSAVIPAPLVAALTGGDAEMARLGLEAGREEHPAWALGGTLAGATGAYSAGGRAIGALGRSALGSRLPTWLTQTPSSYAALTPRAVAGDAAYGAIQGVGENSDPLSGAAENTIGGMFGRKVVRGAGRLFAGSRDLATRSLTGQGIPLTVGQIAGQGGRAGQAVRGVEQRLAGIPVLGDFISGQYRRGLEGFNRAAFDDALAPIGGRNAGRLGEDALENARGLRSDAYDDALGGVRLNVDPQLTADLTAARAAGRAVPMSLPNQFDYTMSRNVDPFIASPSGFSGGDYQTAIRGVRRARSANMNELNGYDFGQALGSVEGALTGAVERQAPGVVPALTAANQTNRMVSTLGEAMRPAVNQVDAGSPVFTPAQLGRASIANTTKYGGRDAAMSSARPFFDLQRDAQQLLPNRVPESGTAGRMVLPLLAGGVLGGGGAGTDALGLTENGATAGLSIAGLLSLPYTNPGQRALQALLVRRPDLSRQIGGLLLTSGPTRAGGMFGSAGAGYASGRE